MLESAIPAARTDPQKNAADGETTGSRSTIRASSTRFRPPRKAFWQREARHGEQVDSFRVYRRSTMIGIEGGETRTSAIVP
jgi:hypothetical protein